MEIQILDLNQIYQMPIDEIKILLNENPEVFLKDLENIIELEAEYNKELINNIIEKITRILFFKKIKSPIRVLIKIFNFPIIQNDYFLLKGFINILIEILDTFEKLNEIPGNFNNFIIEFNTQLENKPNQIIESLNKKIYFYFYLFKKNTKYFEIYLEILSRDRIKSFFLDKYSKIIENLQDYNNLIDLFNLLNFTDEFRKEYRYLRKIFKEIEIDLEKNFEKRRNIKILREYLKSHFGDLKHGYREIIKIFKVIYQKEQEILQILDFEILNDVLFLYYNNSNQVELLENLIKYLIFKHGFNLYEEKSYFNKLSTNIYNELSVQVIEKWKNLSSNKKINFYQDLILISKFLLKRLDKDKKIEFIKKILTTYNLNFDFFKEILKIEKLYRLLRRIFSEKDFFFELILNLKEVSNLDISNLEFLIERPFYILKRFNKENFTNLLLYIFKSSRNPDYEFSKYLNFLSKYKKKIYDLVDHLKLFEYIEFNISWSQMKEFSKIFYEIISKYELEKKIKTFYVYSKIFFEIERTNFFTLISKEGFNNNVNKKLSTPKSLIQSIFKDILSKLKVNFNSFLENLAEIGTIFSYFIYFEWFLKFKNISLNNESNLLLIKDFIDKMYEKYSLHYFNYFQKLLLIISTKLDKLTNVLISTIHLNEEFIKEFIKSKEDYVNLLQSSLGKKYILDDVLQDFISNISNLLESPIEKIFNGDIIKEINFIIVALKNNEILVALPILLVVIEKLMLNFLKIICKPYIKPFIGFKTRIYQANKKSWLKIKYYDGNFLYNLKKEESNKLIEYYDKRSDYFHSDSLPSNKDILLIIVLLNTTLKLIPDIIERNLCLLFLQEKGEIDENTYVKKFPEVTITDTKIVIKLETLSKKEFPSINVKELNDFIEKFTNKN